MADVIGVLKQTGQECLYIDSFFLHGKPVHTVRFADNSERTLTANKITLMSVNGVPIKNKRVENVAYK